MSVLISALQSFATRSIWNFILNDVMNRDEVLMADVQEIQILHVFCVTSLMKGFWCPERLISKTRAAGERL